MVTLSYLFPDWEALEKIQISKLLRRITNLLRQKVDKVNARVGGFGEMMFILIDILVPSILKPPPPLADHATNSYREVYILLPGSLEIPICLLSFPAFGFFRFYFVIMTIF